MDFILKSMNKDEKNKAKVLYQPQSVNLSISWILYFAVENFSIKKKRMDAVRLTICQSKGYFHRIAMLFSAPPHLSTNSLIAGKLQR